MRNVMVRDCSISGKPRPASMLSGFDAADDVKGVTIANLRIQGKVARTLEEAGIRVGPFVSDVHIQSHD